MGDRTRCLICNCEKTMPLDDKKLSKALGEDIGQINMSLCRAQLSNFENALQSGDDLIVACTQEAPLFHEVAEELAPNSNVTFVNIRETAGWSKDSDKASAKIAALLKNSNYEATPALLKSIKSDGMCLIYGSGEVALDAAKLLSDKLSVTLLLDDAEEFTLPATGEIPIYRGDITSASGSFGNFSITVDNYAPLRPASRSGLEFAVARNGATSNCSLILDLSGNAPLFTGHEHRDGYARVDAGDPAGILRAVLKLSDMVGEFEKPIYVDYNPDICAHSRSKKQGCNKCLDVCPAGAITDSGDTVEIDSGICGGCGSCNSVCPTGAINYQYPQRNDTLTRVQNLLSDYKNAGGKNPILFIHDDISGFEMIAAIARYSEGLPANVIPFGMHATTSLGHIEIAGMIASGASQIIFLTNPQRIDELSGLKTEVKLANAILEGLKLNPETRIQIICEADPEKVENTLWNLSETKPLNAKSFQAVGSKRDISRIIFNNLHEHSKAKPDVIALPDKAPYGRLNINEDACTLCMACTSSCPTGAISDTPGEPKLRFTQSACVQCGLCADTCPEKALSLVPQLDFTASAMQPETLYEEEPFECISCGAAFATKSTIERISNQLAGKHSMFEDEERSNLIKMCENCRVEAQANSSSDPFSAGTRPRPRTTEDYIAAENGELTAEDFLIDE